MGLPATTGLGSGKWRYAPGGLNFICANENHRSPPSPRPAQAWADAPCRQQHQDVPRAFGGGGDAADVRGDCGPGDGGGGGRGLGRAGEGAADQGAEGDAGADPAGGDRDVAGRAGVDPGGEGERGGTGAGRGYAGGAYVLREAGGQHGGPAGVDPGSDAGDWRNAGCDDRYVEGGGGAEDQGVVPGGGAGGAAGGGGGASRRGGVYGFDR